jgi:Arc/MetJ-type ribon-helix-helix transcriptional regulator
MKLSVSLPDADVAFIDDFAARSGEPSRSSVLQRAVRLLRMAELDSAYEGAYREWEAGEDAQLWEATAADGLADAPR